MTITPLPSTPADISIEWMTAVLHGSGALSSSGSVAAISHTPVGEGVGMLSEIEFLGLTYDGVTDDAPASVVVKFPTANETNREVARHYDVYSREVRYFSELDALSAAPGPRVHLAQGDEDHFVLVLEDLSDYRTGDQIIGADLAETESAIDALAMLHSSFWGRMDGEEFDWLPRSANSQNATNMLGGAVAGWDNTVALFDHHIASEITAAKDRYLAAVPAMQERLDLSPRTLIHGDFRMDNLFFGQTPEHHPMTFVDWQGPCRGRGIQDVAYLMCQSTQTEVRRDHERELIARYVDALAANGASGYPFDEAWADYRNAVLYLWVFVCTIAGTLDATNDRGNAWMQEMTARNAAAIMDLDCLDLLPD